MFERTFKELHFGAPFAQQTTGSQFVGPRALRLGASFRGGYARHPPSAGRHPRTTGATSGCISHALKKEAARSRLPPTSCSSVCFDTWRTEFSRASPHQVPRGEGAGGSSTTARHGRITASTSWTWPFRDRHHHGDAVRASTTSAQDPQSCCRAERRRDGRRNVCLVTFMPHTDLGCFGDETCRLGPVADPFTPSVTCLRG